MFADAASTTISDIPVAMVKIVALLLQADEPLQDGAPGSLRDSGDRSSTFIKVSRLLVLQVHSSSMVASLRRRGSACSPSPEEGRHRKRLRAFPHRLLAVGQAPW